MTAWRRATPDERRSADEGAPDATSVDAATAQDGANFRVFDPGWLPGDCSVTDVRLRPEAPPAADGTPFPPVVRFQVEGPSRAFRLEQSLPDSGPLGPGVGTLADVGERFRCEDAIGWFGTDDAGRETAVAVRGRSRLALVVEDGSVDQTERQRTLSSLSPLDTPAGRAVAGVPFHELSYWVRYRVAPPAGEADGWDPIPARPYDACRRLAPMALQRAQPAVPVPPGEHYELDSAVAFPEASATEAVFRHRMNHSDHLWMTAVDADSPIAPDLPPSVGRDLETAETTEGLRPVAVHLRVDSEDDGPWAAYWTDGDVVYAVHVAAGLHLDGERFRALVGAFRTP